jgi:phenylpropionate dioxygenase-like ring-hydroxylating dioxygenase large terminal subunit
MLGEPCSDSEEMKVSSLNSSHYWSEDKLSNERDVLFKNLWRFACPYSLVASHNSYFLTNYQDTQVVVQNISGRIYAYTNRCAHRQFPLYQKPYGARHPQCPYHGWSLKVSDDGEALYAQPCSLFEENDSLVAVSLYKIEVHSGLVFFADESVGHALLDQLPESGMRPLEQCLESINRRVLISHCQRGFNWKLIEENLRDPVHPYFLHKSSLLQLLDSTLDDTCYRQPSGKKKNATPLEIAVKSSDFFTHKIKSFEAERIKGTLEISSSYDGHYLNWLLFPGLHISSSDGGKTCLIESYTPITPCQTMVTMFLITNKRMRHAPSYLNAYFMHALNILEEDYSALELIQESLGKSMPSRSLHSTVDANIDDLCEVVASLDI